MEIGSSIFLLKNLNGEEKMEEEKMKVVFVEDNRTKVARGIVSDVGNFVKVTEKKDFILINKNNIITMKLQRVR